MQGVHNHCLYFNSFILRYKEFLRKIPCIRFLISNTSYITLFWNYVYLSNIPVKVLQVSNLRFLKRYCKKDYAVQSRPIILASKDVKMSNSNSMLKGEHIVMMSLVLLWFICTNRTHSSHYFNYLIIDNFYLQRIPAKPKIYYMACWIFNFLCNQYRVRLCHLFFILVSFISMIR